jgi:hypothetical protein
MTYKVQIGDLVRDANAEETEAIDKRNAEAESEAQAKADKATAKASAIAKLGLTADEVAALFS